MKKIVLMLALVAASLLAEPYKAVIDCTSADARYMLTRMMLIEQTAKMIKAEGEIPEFVVIMRGGATPFIAKDPAPYTDDKDLVIVQKLQGVLKTLFETYRADIYGCEIAMEKFDVKKKELLPFVKTTPNSFMDIIRLQNRGYGLLSFTH
jgi:intracellular sulfur oxidation DsrE/DsrF family protein